MGVSQKWRPGLPALIAASVLCAALPGVALSPAMAGAAGNDASALPPSGTGRGMTGPLLSSPLASSMRVLDVPTLELPQPLGTGSGISAIDGLATVQKSRTFAALPAPAIFVTSGASGSASPAHEGDDTSALRNLAFDLVLELPGLTADGADLAATYGALAARLGGTLPYGSALSFAGEEETMTGVLPDGDDFLLQGLAPGENAPEQPALHHDPVAIFNTSPDVFPPMAFEYEVLAGQGVVPLPLLQPAATPELTHTSTHSDEPEGIWPSPAQRLELKGAGLKKAQKCLAEAVYFESRGEPRRGQIAVAQVVINRAFSGYYPSDICGVVYQNAHQKLACQFTFACDDVKDVVREPQMWTQANEIAADMLDGKLWLDTVGRATHYHAHWVHPAWVGEMRKLDRIGVHTFYRPLNWKS